ncbi:MAG TPA: cytochrome c [Myxococcota bacterium]|nr:cytochrome c [Myxococcota bacterium]
MGENSLELDGRAVCGQATHVDHCSVCHGSDGLGTESGPSLFEMMPMHSDPELVMIVAAGAGEMPGFDFEPQQIADLLAFLHAEFDPP